MGILFFIYVLQVGELLRKDPSSLRRGRRGHWVDPSDQWLNVYGLWLMFYEPMVYWVSVENLYYEDLIITGCYFVI